MAFSWGTRSAFTKFCAKVATSTPEPALNDEIRLCAAALLAAAVCAAVVAPLVAVLVVLELTAEVAMGFFGDL
jgi:H+/Cl- antiporter ClcA